MVEDKKIKLGHGSGGKLSQDLFKEYFQPRFANEYLDEVHDGAIFSLDSGKVAFSTDTFVVNPLFFPGGNIGDLAVNGTVNDVAMCGADPRFLSAGFILEEGFEISKLETILQSMQEAAEKAGVKLVTGDTKVVENGSADGLYINTTGIGSIREGVNISPRNAKIGDVVIVNGPIAEHGIAVMTKRKGLEFDSDIKSDCASLNHLISSILDITTDVHVLRDPTRGGIAATLNEIAESANAGIEINEDDLLIDEQVKSISSILGLDPFYIANEGKVLVVIPEHYAQKVLDAMKTHPEGEQSSVIGRVVEKNPGKVILKTTIGTRRIIDMPSGEQLPRIC